MIYVEELIGPETVNTMPLETIKAFQDHGEVRGDTVLEGVDEARAAARRAARGRRRLRRRRRDARGRGRAEVRRLVRRSCSTGSARSAASWRPRDRPRELVERIWARDPTVWTGRDEAKWLGWLDEPRRMRERRRPAARRSPTTRPTASTTSCCSGWAGRRSRPEVLRRSLPASSRSTCSTRRTRRRSARLESQLDLVAHALRRRVEVGLDARDALARRLLLGADRPRRAAGPRSPTRARSSRSSRASAASRAVFPGEPTIGGRYSALSPFGMVPAALMGDRRRAAARPRARDGRGVPPRRGQPGPRARALARRGLARRPRQGLRSLTSEASASGPSS